ncbi:MAG: tRNA-dihydrouridine synthase family protein [Myxococcota bacterium]
MDSVAPERPVTERSISDRARALPARTAPFRLTGLPFRQPTMLAPMEGVTHPMFRQLMADLGGIGIVCTEFVRVSRAPLSAPALAREVIKAEGVPLSVQVMGNEADKMAEAAEVISDNGAEVVDINLGCPMPRVVKKGVGAAMLTNPELLFEVLCSMRARVHGLLSAKIRAGFDDADDVLGIASVVEKAGVDFLVVHPRRRADFYQGTADWRIVKALKEFLRMPVVGNGDIWYAEDALRMERETGCDGVMIGRPALRNPWIFDQIQCLREGRTPFRPDGPALLAHLELVRRRYEETYGNALGRMKELLRYIGRAVADDRAFMKEALRSQSMDALMEVVVRALRHRSAAELDLDAFGSLRLERSGSALDAASAA